MTFFMITREVGFWKGVILVIFTIARETRWRQYQHCDGAAQSFLPPFDRCVRIFPTCH